MPTDIRKHLSPAKIWITYPTVIISFGLLLFYLLLYLMPLGSRPLMIPDETRYAEIPREMLANGNWVVPHLNGLRYFEKPPLGYWLHAASIKVIGENAYAVRFVSAFAAGLTALLVLTLARQLSKRQIIPVFAALIYLTFMEVYLIGITSVLDNLLTLFLTAGIISFYFAAIKTDQDPHHQNRWWISGVCFGFAFLTKGFLAFALPLLILVPWILWQGWWRMLVTKGWRVICAAILIVLPWSILIHLQEQDFWRYFFWIEHVKRFAGNNAQHKEPFYYFLIYLPVLAFPWLNLVPAAIPGLQEIFRNDSKKRGTLRLLWLWLILPFIFFSASSGKLVTYILPCFPAFAVLISAGLIRYLNDGRSKLFDFGILLNTLTFLGLVLALWIGQAIDIGFRVYDVNEDVRVFLLSFTLLTSIGAGLTAFLKTRSTAKLVASLVMITPFLFVISFVLPNQVLEHKAPGQLLMQYKEKITDDTIIISDSDLIRAAAWYLKRDDIYLIGQGELEYGLSYADAAHRLLDHADIISLLDNNPAPRSVLLLCHRACNAQVENLLPKAAQKRDWGEFTLWFSAEAP